MQPSAITRKLTGAVPAAEKLTKVDEAVLAEKTLPVTLVHKKEGAVPVTPIWLKEEFTPMQTDGIEMLNCEDGIGFTSMTFIESSETQPCGLVIVRITF